MSSNHCDMKVEIDSHKFIDLLPKAVSVEFKCGGPDSPDKALQITHHIIDCFIQALEKGKDDMKFCAYLSRGLNLSAGWTEQAFDEMVNKLVADTNLNDKQKETARKILKALKD